jgi:hypothetical protein
MATYWSIYLRASAVAPERNAEAVADIQSLYFMTWRHKNCQHFANPHSCVTGALFAARAHAFQSQQISMAKQEAVNGRRRNLKVSFTELPRPKGYR